MDELTKKRLLKSGKLSTYDIDSPEEILADAREAAELLGIRGSGTRSKIIGVAGRMIRRSFLPFGWGDPAFEQDDIVIRCIGYELVAYEHFRAENGLLLYLDSDSDTGGQYRRIETRDGQVVQVCRSGLLREENNWGHIEDEVDSAHPLTTLLGERLRWFLRVDDQIILGIGEYAFEPATGDIIGEEVLLQRWRRAFKDGIKSDLPVLLGYEEPNKPR